MPCTSGPIKCITMHYTRMDRYKTNPVISKGVSTGLKNFTKSIDIACKCGILIVIEKRREVNRFKELRETKKD